MFLCARQCWKMQAVSLGEVDLESGSQSRKVEDLNSRVNLGHLAPPTGPTTLRGGGRVGRETLIYGSWKGSHYRVLATRSLVHSFVSARPAMGIFQKRGCETRRFSSATPRSAQGCRSPHGSVRRPGLSSCTHFAVILKVS